MESQDGTSPDINLALSPMDKTEGCSWKQEPPWKEEQLAEMEPEFLGIIKYLLSVYTRHFPHRGNAVSLHSSAEFLGMWKQ